MRQGVFVVLIGLSSAVLSVESAPTTQSSVPSPPRYAEKLREFERFVLQQMEQDKIPGLTVGFSKGDDVWVRGFGYSDLERKIPATAQSAYRLASVSKPITAAAILQLAESAAIDLDADVRTYVPDYLPQKWPVTIRQLLGHLGGGQSGSGLGPDRKTVREVVAAIGARPLIAEPGSRFLYTTSGYNLLGAAIETASGETFGAYLRRSIFQPLAMANTGLDDGSEPVAERVAAYTLAGGRIERAPAVDISTRFGGGGLIGTVPDVLRFARALNAGKVISKDALARMYEPMVNKDGRAEAPPAGADTGYAMGWFVSPLNGRFYAEHGGAQTGTQADLFVIPSEDFAVAFACNRDSSGAFLYSPYVQRLYELIFDERWVIPVYTRTHTDASLYEGMRTVFDNGAAFFDRNGRALSSDPRLLARSFAFFNRTANRTALESAHDSTTKAIGDGRHPVSEQAFVVAGSYMASRLLERYGRLHFDSYHKRGAIDFFADYVTLYRGDPAFPEALKFEPAFEKMIVKWRLDWTRTWNDETRHLRIGADSDLRQLGVNLRRTFGRAEIVPNFLGPLLGTAQRLFFTNNLSQALQAAVLAADLYPQNERAAFAVAVHALSVGDRDRARKALKKSARLNPHGIASAAQLRTNALELAGAGKLNEGIALLRLGAEMYPRDAGFDEALLKLSQR